MRTEWNTEVRSLG